MANTVDERFKCAECGRVSASAANLKVHMRTHTGEKPYECRECGKSYACSRNLKNHMGVHGEERPFQCPECPKSFVLSKALKDHQRSHSNERPFCCTYCGRAFRYKNVLRSHLIIHTGEGPHKCSECGMCYTTQSRLNQHMRSHTNERPYVCDVCGDDFTMNSALARHKVLHTGERKYECSVCNKKFIVPSDLSLHMQAHSGERHQCRFCGRSFKYKNMLQKHMRQADAKGPQICSVCTKEFNRYCQLKEHMKTHKGRQIYNCTKCDKSFMLLTYLNEHMKSHTASRSLRKSRVRRQVAGANQQKVVISPAEGDRVQKCNICWLEFNNQIMLHAHQMTHTNENNTEREDTSMVLESGTFTGNSFECIENNSEGQNTVRDIGNISQNNFECNKNQREGKSVIYRSENAKTSTGEMAGTNRTGIDGKLDFENIISEFENVMNKKNQFNDTDSLNANELYHGTDCANTNVKNSVMDSSREKMHGYNDGTNFINDAVDLIGLSSITSQVDQRLHQYTENNESSEHTSIMAERVHFSSVAHPYQCSECEKCFRTAELLQCHIKTHKEERPSVCNYHGKGFEHKNAVQTQLIHHTGVEPQKCTICGMCFTSPSKLQQHVMRKHTNERPYVCDICGKGFKCNFVLNKHKVVHTGDKKYHCTMCEEKFQLATELKSHMRIHTCQMYFCSLCSKSFTERIFLKRHVIQSESKGPRKCSVCFMVLKGNCQLKEHMKSHMAKEILKCIACKKTFMLRWHYNEHMKTHKVVNSQQFLESHHSDTSNCQQNQSSYQGSLGKHKKVNINENSFIDTENVVTENNSKSILNFANNDMEENGSHSGDECNSSTPSDEEKIFINKRMNISGWRIPLGTRFKCTECGKISARFSDLTMHMSLDIEEIPYQCCDCDKRCIRTGTNDIPATKENQSNDKPVECKTSSREENTIENGTKKSYQCSWCDFNSTHNSQLRQHLKSHRQAAESHSCNLCAMIFHSETSLELHKKTHTTQGEAHRDGMGRIPQQHIIPPHGSEGGSNHPPFNTVPPGYPSYHNRGFI